MFVIPVSRHLHHQEAEFARQIERMFKTDTEAVSLRSPALDVKETEHSYVLQLDLPGVNKEAVKISIEGRRVSIDAEQAKPEQATNEAGQAAEQVLHQERALTRFSRSIVLPKEVSQSDSKAKLELGVLTLTLAKRQPAAASHLPVM
ncbi:Hsp20/alpha crystallin family protein [Roseateles sp.]|uniref:Hsp20/alpha crystallin family protein n=1 Tax=Roseateles sp. TaxID=1971397 RepID=UPI003BA5031C